MTAPPPATTSPSVLAVVACLAGMALFAYLTDAAMAWGRRAAFDRTFGLPRAFRVADEHPARGRSRAWVNLRVDTLGGASGLRVLGLATDEGLAVDVRTWIGSRLMRTVVIPWRSLRLEVGPPPHRGRRLVVIDPERSVAASFPIKPFDLRWRDDLARRIEAGTPTLDDPGRAAPPDVTPG